jgi:carboxylesterase type B
VQYRLGSLGFLAVPDHPQLAGNFGLKDQTETLRWLQGSLAGFGGDPGRVTIFGSGSGAVSVHAHLLSPLGDGLFQAGRRVQGRAVIGSSRAPSHRAATSSRSTR